MQERTRDTESTLLSSSLEGMRSTGDSSEGEEPRFINKRLCVIATTAELYGEGAAAVANLSAYLFNTLPNYLASLSPPLTWYDSQHCFVFTHLLGC